MHDDQTTHRDAAAAAAGSGRRRRSRSALVLAAAAALVLGACGASDSDGATASPTSKVEAATSTTEAPAAEPIQILVSNDDGYAAEGIDALVVALQTLDDVEITVVAPLEQQSGTGGKTTDGELAVTDVQLASGHAAKAVDGFPADSVRVAMDDLGSEPDLVVTGINLGQNLGPVVDLSGTVGAARAAVARGVPALATSSGLGDPVDYDAATPLILTWIEEHRKAIVAGDEPVAVTNLNVPTCATGEVRGLVETTTDLDGDGGQAITGISDCASTTAKDPAAGDLTEFLLGFATITPVAATPG